MRFNERGLRLAATDLSGHLGCRHYTTLELAAVRGERRPPYHHDPRLEALRQRGDEHERSFVAHLRERGLTVDEIPVGALEHRAAALTLEAMLRGSGAIVQATLVDDHWLGRADVLVRVERPSPGLGSWSYEPYDAKLARETKAGAVLQLCLYADLLATSQGVLPEHVHVVPPGAGFAADSYRTDEHIAYYRSVRHSLESHVDLAPHDGQPRDETYPRPCSFCEVCRWSEECDARWRAEDHLCLVAGMRRSAERELGTEEVKTAAALGSWAIPPSWRPRRGALASYSSLQHQAELQVASRGQALPLHELLPLRPEAGLARLPEPSIGDVFLDLEGDPFFGDAGLEYLFGFTTVAGYRCWWAIDRLAERVAFESVVDELIARWSEDPGLHVYHFGHYEPSALKRLASRHGTREAEIDRLLRAGRFVDLLKVVRQGVRVGVESYSIKCLEALYGFRREAPLREAGRVRAEAEMLLEVGRGAELTVADCDLIAAYNRDDCLSTAALRGWLEDRRTELVVSGVAVSRWVNEGDGAPTEALSARLSAIRALAARLLVDVPDEPSERSADQKARWLLAQLLEFYRREEKVSWWELFRLADLDEEERQHEPRAIAGLRFEGRTPPVPPQRSSIDRYTFPPQEVDGRSSKVHLTAERKFGEVVGLDAAEGWVEIKKRGDALDEHPASVFLHDHVNAGAKADSLVRLAEEVLAHSLEAEGPFRAACDLLLGTTARGCTRIDGSLRHPCENPTDSARRLVNELAGGVLPVQGPPGAGKTYTGARMVVELVRQGKRVGISALSHKVIRNLVDAVVAAAAEENVSLRCVVKVSDDVEPADESSGILEARGNDQVHAALATGEAQVGAGTAWLWAREEMLGAVDVLFIDEAGQMSLTDALAVAPAARNLVLLGDPQQLEQPLKGAHPDGCDIAALAQLLDGKPTLPPGSGLFLEHTRRLHPALCAFTSEQFYEGRLASWPGLELQALTAEAPFDRSGIYFVPVEHEGNQNVSTEEADVIGSLVAKWLSAAATWTDRSGARNRLGLDDILVVAPYNAQLGVIRERLPSGARVGTVDKFQGQEAAVVIYSLTTSSPEEAPRGMEFLYSRNRLNVATSRAFCACVLVASPRLLAPECRTPRQMRLANALCRYVELAIQVPAPHHS